jgi:hypothetical protein
MIDPRDQGRNSGGGGNSGRIRIIKPGTMLPRHVLRKHHKTRPDAERPTKRERDERGPFSPWPGTVISCW